MSNLITYVPLGSLSIQKVSSLASISASSTDLKEFKLHTVYFGISEQINLFTIRWSGDRVQD